MQQNSRKTGYFQTKDLYNNKKLLFSRCFRGFINKTTLKDLLNSSFIIIYRFSPSLHKKRAVLPAKSSKPYSQKQPSRILVSNINNLLRIKPFNLRQLFCNIFYIAAVVSFTSVRLRCHIWTVCLQNNSIHRYIRCCFHKLLAFLNVRTPPIPIEKPMLRKSLAASMLYE